MEEGEECECSDRSGEGDEDMSSGRSISRRDLGSPVISIHQLLHCESGDASIPDRLMTVEVISETPTEITKLSLVQSSMRLRNRVETYSNIIGPSLEVVNRFNEWCRESRKPEKEGGNLFISFVPRG